MNAYTLLRQQAQLRCEEDLAVPAYSQYPLGRGIVLSLCAPDGNGLRGSHAAHQLYIEDGADLEALCSLRPLPETLFDLVPESIAIEPLKPDVLRDDSTRERGLALIQDRFSEWLLSELMTALIMAARDKRLSVRILLGGPEDDVSREGRLIMETVLRALPMKDALRLSYLTATRGEPPMRADVMVLPADRAAGAGEGAVLFDLEQGVRTWPGLPPAADEWCTAQARALLRGDFDAVDELRHGGQSRPLTSARPGDRIALTPFRRDMDLIAYFETWAVSLTRRRADLDATAYEALCAAQWPLMMDQLIQASELMPRWDYVTAMAGLAASLRGRRRTAQLCVTDQVRSDLSAVLLDAINWDEVDLTDPEHVKTVRRAVSCVESCQDGACGKGCLLACRVMRSVINIAGTSVHDLVADLGDLFDMRVAVYGQVQACARRYVQARCQRAADDEFALADEMLVAAAIVGWAQFAGAIPDFRPLEQVRLMVARAAGKEQSRRFAVILDDLRRHMHASRQGQPRQGEMRVMLGISLGLFIVILGVVVSYFLFVR